MSRCLVSGALLVLALAATAISVRARPTGPAALHLPGTPYRYARVVLPAHLIHFSRNDDNTPPDNPLTDDGATLGRVLFYDTRLSANNRTSCASCHLQAHAFSDPRRASQGFRGALTGRCAMPLVNLRYYERARFFWDERAGNLEEMVLQPIHSRVEMGQDSKTLVALLAHDPVYRGLFERAFGDPRFPNRGLAERSPSSLDRWCRTSCAMTKVAHVRSRGRSATLRLLAGCRKGGKSAEVRRFQHLSRRRSHLIVRREQGSSYRARRTARADGRTDEPRRQESRWISHGRRSRRDGRHAAGATAAALDRDGPAGSRRCHRRSEAPSRDAQRAPHGISGGASGGVIID